MTAPHSAHADYDHAENSHFTWKVNGHRTSKEHSDILTEHYACEEDNSTQQYCPYCTVAMEGGVFKDEPDTRRNDEWCLLRTYRLWSCSNCGYWTFTASESTNRCMDAPVYLVASSVARTFESRLPPQCTSELAQYLRRHPTLWTSLDPLRLERLVADVFRANYCDCEVLHVGKPGDLGIDAVFIDANKCDWLIQVKRRSASKTEGFETLQRLLGTLALEGKTHGIIVTTADYFSRQLLKQRSRAATRGYVIELCDRGKLDRMLSPLLPDRPWLALMRQPIFWQLDGEVREYFVGRTSSVKQRRLF